MPASRNAAARPLARLLAGALLAAVLLSLGPVQDVARAEDDWDAPRAEDRKPPAKDPKKDKPGRQPGKKKTEKAGAAGEEENKDSDSSEPDGGPAGGTAEPAPDAESGTGADEPVQDDKGEGANDAAGAGDAESKSRTDGRKPEGAGNPGSDMFLDIATFDTAAEAEAAADSAGAEEAAGADKADALPPLLRRPRPQTAEQERTWKLNKTREDPFLNPPGGDLGSGLQAGLELYRPSDWLSRELPLDYSVYLAQDAKGKLLGLMSLTVQTRKGEKGEDLVVLSRSTDFGLPARTEVLSSLDGLRPRLILREAIRPEILGRPTGLAASPDAEPQLEGDAVVQGPLPVPNLRVEYLYDRVTIVWDDGDVASHQRMRALPHSFDVQQLPLIMRLLDYSTKQWPFEAYITLPEKQSSAPLVITGAPLQNQLSAEGEKVPCYHVTTQIGEAKWEWWVQKALPHRLIRFSDGELTYTLSEYSQSSRGGY